VSDIPKKFHEFALKSILFKGRADWYFCYLKAEKIAHVLAVLVERTPSSDAQTFRNLVHSAIQLPQTMLHFVAGEIDLAVVLADIFGLLSGVRLSTTQGLISTENSLIIIEEYEQIAQKMSGTGQLSPFITREDFSVPSIQNDIDPPMLSQNPSRSLDVGSVIKDINKRHYKGHQNSQKGHSDAVEERVSIILGMLKKNDNLSIKDISAVVKNCSEKTIQRELAALIEKGLVRKEGERRWSVYRLA
jgi:predicted transcriptional regulator